MADSDREVDYVLFGQRYKNAKTNASVDIESDHKLVIISQTHNKTEKTNINTLRLKR